MTANPRSADLLNIALLAPLVAPIRQPYLGGAQALLRDLAVMLAERGHVVTLYAAPGSDADALPGVALREVEVDAAHVRPTDFTTPRDADSEEPVDPAVTQAFTRAFDLIAAHTPHHDLTHAHAYDGPSFSGAQALRMPVAHTLHMAAFDPTINTLLATLSPAQRPRTARQPWLTTVSHACAASYRDICRIDAVIYNGLDIASIPFEPRPAPDAHALFAGRVTPEKGVEDAIHIALTAGVRLTLVGDIYDQRYYAERIVPLLAAHPHQLTYLGPQSRERVWSLMSAASAVLVPSLWDEPFGLVACEAQAAGTPVIGYGSGGLREVISQGGTGLLVPRGDIVQAAAALRDVARFSRQACHDRAVSRFSLASTVDQYEALYWRMISARP